jgi:hypothetical protein
VTNFIQYAVVLKGKYRLPLILFSVPRQHGVDVRPEQMKKWQKISGPRPLLLFVISDSYSFRCGSLPYPESAAMKYEERTESVNRA